MGLNGASLIPSTIHVLSMLLEVPRTPTTVSLLNMAPKCVT